MSTERPDNEVTDEQDGQFSVVSDDIPISVAKGDTDKHAAGASELLRRDAGDVQADSVSMERSGAEHVEAQRLTMLQSGARTLSAKTAQLDNSGAVRASADNMVLQNSSAILANANEMRLVRSRAVMANAGDMSAEQGVQVGMLNTASLETTGDVRAVFLMAGEVKADGEVKVTFDAPSAFALGAGVAAVLIVIRGILRRIF